MPKIKKKSLFLKKYLKPKNNEEKKLKNLSR